MTRPSPWWVCDSCGGHFESPEGWNWEPEECPVCGNEELAHAMGRWKGGG